MLKFNDDNIYVGYIKNFLHSFNLPYCKIDRPSNKYYVGEYFINTNKNAIYKVISVNENNELQESEFVCAYKFDDEILNVTKRLELKNNFYDAYTHEYLGEYLRFIRDFKDIDLMSMYNCFSNNCPSQLNVELLDENENVEKVMTTLDGDYTIYMIPVKPNTEYTIALEYHQSIEMFVGHYAFNNFIPSSDKLKPGTLEHDTYRRYCGLRFTNPITIQIPDEPANMLTQEKNLKLFIKVPTLFNKTIVVLEGNYTKATSLMPTEYGLELSEEFFNYVPQLFPYVNEETHTWFFNGENTEVADTNCVVSCTYVDNKQDLGLPEDYTHQQYNLVSKDVFRVYTIVFSNDTTKSYTVYNDRVVDEVIKYDYTSKNQLLSSNSSTKYLLADRIVEYLSNNAITPEDEIIDNIRKVQVVAAGNIEDKVNFNSYGIWDESLRKWIFRYLNNHTDKRGVKYIDNYTDMLSYVDKDVEYLLKSLPLSVKAKEVLKDLGGDDNGI